MGQVKLCVENINPTIYYFVKNGNIILKKLKYTPAVRSNILSKLIFASCV